MTSVGPQLPPHLSKRKRSIDEADPPTSPPHKVLAASVPSTNTDALDIDSGSDDGYGPSVPSTKPAPKPFPPRQTAGPSLPPPANPDELDVEESSDDDYGPSAAAPAPKQPPPPVPKKRILGPAAPPAPLSELPSHPANDSSSDSDDDYGPSLPPPPGSAAASRLQAEAEVQTAHSNAPQAAPKAQRAEWMLVPPTSSDWSSRIDPTKLKNRKFASGKGSKAPADKSGGISAIWTETPEEKRQRLEDEVLGRKDAATSARAAAGPREGRVESREERETARRIREYNEKARGRSLYAEHEEMKGAEAKEKEDDPSKRGFDREKDMALGGRLGNGEKKELLAKAKDFGSRFQRGKYL